MSKINDLGISVVNAARLETLTIAEELGADDETLVRLATATRVRRAAEMRLPAEHLEGLSRGRGWCRRGQGTNAVWGQRVDGGYLVGPGRWSVGATDGYRRRSSTTWSVELVVVGDHVWSVAD